MADRPGSRPLDLKGVAITVLCCAVWGGNPIAVKFSVPDLPPLGVAGLRFILAVPMIGLVCRALGYPLLFPREHWKLMAAHVAFTVAQIGTFNWGTTMSLAGRASIFINIHPLVVAPLAWLLLGERSSRRALIGLGAASFGVGVLLYEPFSQGTPVVGDLIVLGSGIIFGVQTIFQKATFKHIPSATMLLWQTILGAPVFLALSLAVEGAGAYHFTTPAVLGVIYQGVITSGVCFTLWMVLLSRYAAAQLATLAFLTPLFGITLGNLTRGEPLTLPLLIGGGLVGLGIYLVTSDKDAGVPDPEEDSGEGEPVRVSGQPAVPPASASRTA